ncbi:MAG: phosphoribosyltransferase [Candidatus Peribacteraceae bacterium]
MDQKEYDEDRQASAQVLRQFKHDVLSRVPEIVPAVKDHSDIISIAQNQSRWGGSVMLLKEAYKLSDTEAQRKALQDLVHSHSQSFLDNSLPYQITVILVAVGLDDTTIYDYTSRRMKTEGFPIGVDYCLPVLEHGTPPEIDLVLHQHGNFASHEDGANSLLFRGKVETALNEIRNEYLRYCQTHQLSTKRVCYPSTLIPNAAYTLVDENYDLTIGIVHGGAPLANYLHVLDQNVVYLEYHRRWEINPRWRVAGRQCDIRSGMKILLCEDDVATGKTLKEVARKLDKLNPSSVGICFTGYHLEKSKQRAQEAGVFDSVRTPNDFDQSHVYSSILNFHEALKSKNKKK